MNDSYGRSIDYLRVSVTDRCNLRCIYCMPEGIENKVHHGDILTYDEIAYIVKIAAEAGIKKIKITGGEPLVRKNLPYLVNLIKRTDGIEHVTLTTNGVLLREQIKKLSEAGLDGINISLDTLDRKKYRLITGNDCFDEVMEAVKLWRAYPDIRFRINAVPLRSFDNNEHGDIITETEDLCSLAALAAEGNVDVRFIELMPIGMGKYSRGFTQDEIAAALENVYGKANYEKNTHSAGPASYYSFEGFKGRIGFISSMTHNFCSSCNRLRLTSEGFLKPCLSYSSGIDLRKLIRAGEDRENILEAVRKAIYMKPAGSGFDNGASKDAEQKLMSDIGG